MKQKGYLILIILLLSGNLIAGLSSAQKREAALRAKDPAWLPKYDEILMFKIGKTGRRGAFTNFCLNDDGNILACYESSILTYSPKGEHLKTINLEIRPATICTINGDIFVAGQGRLIKLNAAGEVLASVESPVASIPVNINEDIEAMIQRYAKREGKTVEGETKRMIDRLTSRRGTVTGLAATSQDIFVSLPTPNSFSYSIYRFDHSLKNPTMIIDKLRGCCGQLDVQAHDQNLWIPHNARHRVESWDREGNMLSKFGKKGKIKVTDFGGCCEPKNMRVMPNGDLLVAEAGPPTCIKRFSAEGEFLGVIGLVPGDSDCLRVTVESSPDGSLYYLMDSKLGAIRVFGPKS